MVREELHEMAPSRDDAFLASVTFVEAVRAGDVGHVRRALAVKPELATTPYPRPALPRDRSHPIHHAVQADQRDMLGLLLEHGAEPLEGWHWNHQALCAMTMAMRQGSHELVDAMDAAIWRRLDDDPTGLDRADADGNSLLHLAVYHGLLRVVLGLVRRGANVDAKNTRGFRPLHFALPPANGGEHGNHDPDMLTAGVLIGHGAEVDVWAASAMGDVEAVKRLLKLIQTRRTDTTASPVAPAESDIRSRLQCTTAILQWPRCC